MTSKELRAYLEMIWPMGFDIRMPELHAMATRQGLNVFTEGDPSVCPVKHLAPGEVIVGKPKIGENGRVYDWLTVRNPAIGWKCQISGRSAVFTQTFMYESISYPCGEASKAIELLLDSELKTGAIKTFKIPDGIPINERSFREVIVKPLIVRVAHLVGYEVDLKDPYDIV